MKTKNIVAVLGLVLILGFFQSCAKSSDSGRPAVAKTTTDTVEEAYKKTGTCLYKSFPTEETPIQCPVAEVVASTLLAGDNKTYKGTCRLTGDLTITNGKKLVFVDADVTLKGNISLAGTAILGVRNSTFNLANSFPFQYKIEAVDDSIFDIRQSVFKTNDGTKSDLSLSSNFEFSDNSQIRFHEVIFDVITSWGLLNLKNKATLESQDTNGVPTEVYPENEANIFVCGYKSGVGVWLRIEKDETAVLDDIPDPKNNFYYSFGRDTPEKTNVKFQVHILDGHAGVSVLSLPGSDISITDNVTPITIGYFIENNTQALELKDLPKGPDLRHSIHLTDQGRNLKLTNVLLTPMAWQIYVSDATTPLSIRDSFVNELGLTNNSTVNIENVDFYYALIATMGLNNHVNISNSRLESQTILSNMNSQITVQNSIIYGSVIQANGSSQIILLNNKLLKNENNPFAGIGEDVRFINTGNGLIVAAGINEFTAVSAGANVSVKADVIVKTNEAGVKPTSYTLSVLNPAQTQIYTHNFSTFGPQQSLTTLNTTGWARGTYAVRLQITIKGMPLMVAKPLQVK